jgi:hypothetical protein
MASPLAPSCSTSELSMSNEEKLGVYASTAIRTDEMAPFTKDQARRAAVEARWAKEKEMRQAESRRAYEASLRR